MNRTERKRAIANTSAASLKKCQARAFAYLVELIGAQPPTLIWDSSHCLQGHAHLGCQEFIVIAARDVMHNPVVFTASDWEAVRRSPSEQRRALIESCAITDHSSLLSILELDETGSRSMAA